MSTIFIAALIILCTIGLTILLISINQNAQNKRSKALLNAFNEYGAEKGLNFSSQEILRQRIIGLDGIDHTILVLDFDKESSFTTINLAEVRSCTLQKEITSIDAGTKKKPEIRQQLRSIGLRFNLNNGHTVSVAFYEDHINNILEINELTTKAKDWEAVLSKMLPKEVRSRA